MTRVRHPTWTIFPSRWQEALPWPSLPWECSDCTGKFLEYRQIIATLSTERGLHPNLAEMKATKFTCGWCSYAKDGPGLWGLEKPPVVFRVPLTEENIVSVTNPCPRHYTGSPEFTCTCGTQAPSPEPAF